MTKPKPRLDALPTMRKADKPRRKKKPTKGREQVLAEAAPAGEHLPVDPEGLLLPAHREFVGLMLVHNFDAGEAYLRTPGFKAKNKEVASAAAHRLLRRPEVQQELKRQVEHRLMRLNLSQDLIIQEWQCLALANIMDLFDCTNEGELKLKNLSELPPAIQRNIKELTVVTTKLRMPGTGVEIGTEQTVKVKLHDRVTVLRHAAEHFGMFIERHQHEIGPNLAEAMRRADERVNRHGRTLEHGE